MANGTKEQYENLIKLLNEAIEQDEKLRAEFEIGPKFRFIREKLHANLSKLQELLEPHLKETQFSESSLLQDEVIIYIYLYNSYGLSLPTWQKMLRSSVLYEYSVNRPTYTDQHAIETYIRSKPNKQLHGFLTIAVKASDILPAGEEKLTDGIGNPLIKVKEGSLHFDKIISFTHNGKVHTVQPDGTMIFKSNAS